MSRESWCRRSVHNLRCIENVSGIAESPQRPQVWRTFALRHHPPIAVNCSVNCQTIDKAISGVDDSMRNVSRRGRQLEELCRMFRNVAANLRACWGTLIISDLLFKAAALLLLTPAASLLFRLFLMASGRTVLADADIARFLLHPLGWLTFVLIGGAVVCIFVLELAVLMTVCIGAEQNLQFRPRNVLLSVAAKAPRLMQLTTRVVVSLTGIALPCIAAGGGVFWLLLTDHDINFYLTNKPPRFWIAVVLIGIFLTVMGLLLLRRISGWALATQLLMYENLSPADAIKVSQQRSLGHRLSIAKFFVGWVAINGVIGLSVSFIVVLFGEWLVPTTTSSLWMLILSVGLVLTIAAAANLITSMIATCSCASLLSILYLKLAAPNGVALPEISERTDRLLPAQLGGGRLLIISAVFGLIAGCVGVSAIHSVELEDRVQITAHRCGAGAAPENTLAAIRQAIKDGTDWIEIDVQESSDGVVVVAHDSDLAKVSGNPVKIWAATAEELCSIDIGSYFSPDFKDERVPTLEEILQTCKGKTKVNIELKYYGHTQDLENRVIELVERFQMQSDVVVMSLESKAVTRMKLLRPDWTVGLLTAVSAGDLTRAQADFLAVNSSLASLQFIQAAHRRNKTVSVWTVNEGYAMSVMISRGVDNLITDYPDLARRVLAERQQMSPLERLMVELAFYLGVKPPTGTPQ